MSLQRLCQLDKLFAERLDTLLHDEECVRGLMELEGDELTQLVDYLSDTATHLIRIGESPRKCLHVLQKISSIRKVLPSACKVSGTLSASVNSPLARGGSSDVHRGSLSCSTNVYVKKIRIERDEDWERAKEPFYREAVAWKHLNHPNIVPFKGVTLDPPQLISEWMPGGELREYIGENPSVSLTHLLLGIAEGLAYLHSCEIIHGDLKGPNIVVDASGNPRITDFGVSCIVWNPNSVANTSNSAGYAPRWTAPEILRNRTPPSKKSDVFSFAMVIFEVFSGTVPFSHVTSSAVPAAIMDGLRPRRPIHPSFTDPLWKLTERCWNDVAEDRPEMVEIVDEIKRVKATLPVPPEASPTGGEQIPYDTDTPQPGSIRLPQSQKAGEGTYHYPKDIKVTPGGRPCGTSESTTAVNIQADVIPISRPTTQEPPSHRDNYKNVPHGPSSGSRVGVNKLPHPPVTLPSKLKSLDSESTIRPQTRTRDDQSEDQTLRPPAPRPRPDQEQPINPTENQYFRNPGGSTPQRLDQMTINPAIPSQLPAAPVPKPEPSPPKKGLLQTMFLCCS